MGRIGKVIKSYIAKLSGSGTNAQFSSVEEFAGDQRPVQIFGPCNEDFAPPENCKTINIPLGRGRGFLVSVAYHNQLITPVALPGERLIYSTNQAGDTVMAKVFLKQDGTLVIENSSGCVELAPSGNILLNGDADSVTAFTDMKTAFDQLITDFNNLVSAYNGHGHTPAVVPQGVPTTADMTAAEVTDVKVS